MFINPKKNRAEIPRLNFDEILRKKKGVMNFKETISIGYF